MVVPALTSPAEISWDEVWPGLETAVLAGRPEEVDAPFVMLCRTSWPLVLGAHTHPSDERITVLAGRLELGLGDDETARVQRLGPGSYVSIPAGVLHTLRTAPGTLLQIHGHGPFETAYVRDFAR